MKRMTDEEPETSEANQTPTGQHEFHVKLER